MLDKQFKHYHNLKMITQGEYTTKRNRNKKIYLHRLFGKWNNKHEIETKRAQQMHILEQRLMKW